MMQRFLKIVAAVAAVVPRRSGSDPVASSALAARSRLLIGFASPTLALLRGGGVLEARDLASGASVWKLKAQKSGDTPLEVRFRDVSLSPNATLLAFEGAGGIEICAARTGALRRTLKTARGQTFDGADFSPDGSLLVVQAGTTEDEAGKPATARGVAGTRSGLVVFSVATGRAISLIRVPNALVRLGVARFINARSGKIVREVKDVPFELITGRPAFSPDGTLVAFGGRARTKVVDARSGKVLADISTLLPAGNNDAWDVRLAWSPDSRRLAWRDGPLVRVLSVR